MAFSLEEVDKKLMVLPLEDGEKMSAMLPLGDAMVEKVTLPRFVALKSWFNESYVHYIISSDDEYGFLKSDGDNIMSPFTRFKVEKDRLSRQGYVHLKCCYNNKYLRRSSQYRDKNWIVPESVDPCENSKDSNCTLFKPIACAAADGRMGVRLLHVQLALYVRISDQEDIPYFGCLCADSKVPDVKKSTDVFTFIDSESLLSLPKYVAFKVENGTYLAAQKQEGQEGVVTFSSDHIDDKCVFMVSTDNNGNIAIQSSYYGKYLCCENDKWLLTDDKYTEITDIATIPGAWFSMVTFPHEHNNNDIVLALRNLGSNLYCRKRTMGNIKDGLAADSSHIVKDAYLTVEEAVPKKNICDVIFHKEVMSYKEEIILEKDFKVINYQSVEVEMQKVLIPYSTTTSTTWSFALSMPIGGKFSIQAGIPDEQLKIGDESIFTGRYNTTTDIKRVEGTHPYEARNLKPRTVTTVKTKIIRDVCRVPFSYSYINEHMDGSIYHDSLHDGIFTGVQFIGVESVATEVTPI